DLSELVHTLIKGPNYETHLRHVFNPLTTLLEEPRLDNGTLELVFNEHILKDTHTGMIANDVVESLVLSLTELELIDKVDIKVKNKHELVNEDGKAYTEPISLNHIRKQDNL